MPKHRSISYRSLRQLLSEIKVLFEFLQYLYQSDKVNIKDIFANLLPPPLRTNKVIQQQIIEAVLDDIQTIILGIEAVKIIQNNRRETLIQSLREAEDAHLAAITAARKKRPRSQPTPTSLTRPHPAVKHPDSDSKEIPEEKAPQTLSTTEAFKAAHVYFMNDSIDLALTTLKNIKPESPPQKIEQLTFMLRCLFKNFDKQRYFIDLIIKTIESQIDYIKENRENFHLTKARKIQRDMDLDIIRLFSLIKKYEIAFGPAATINQEAHEFLTQYQQDIILQVTTDDSQNIPQEIRDACKYLDDWELDITNLGDDIAKKQEFKAWSTYWSDTMVKSTLGLNADPSLIAFHSNELQNNWDQFIDNYDLLQTLSQRTNQYITQRRDIIKYFKSQGYINRNTRYSQESQHTLDVLQWVQEKNATLVTHVRTVSKSLSKGKGITLLDEQKHNEPSNPITPHSQPQIYSNPSPMPYQMPPPPPQPDPYYAATPQPVPYYAAPPQPVPYHPIPSQPILYHAAPPQIPLAQPTPAHMPISQQQGIPQTTRAFYSSPSTFFQPPKPPSPQPPNYTAIKQKIIEILKLIPVQDSNSEAKDISSNCIQIKEHFDTAFGWIKPSEDTFIPLLHSTRDGDYELGKKLHQAYLENKGHKLKACKKLLENVLAQIDKVLDNASSEVVTESASITPK